MNDAIVDKWNSVVKDGDLVYVLGDVYLGKDNHDLAIKYLNYLNGRKRLIIGNHDTNNKIDNFINNNIFENIEVATVVKYGKKSLYLSHYPTIVANEIDKSKPKKKIYNFFGHTHQKEPLYGNYLNMFHVGCDSWDCCPKEIDEIFFYLQKVSE